MTNKFYIKSKAKTFYKGQDKADLLLFVIENAHSHLKHEPETTGVDQRDMRTVLSRKYVITIKEVR